MPGVYGLTTNVTVVDKTDNNGNLQWQKIFDDELMIKTSDAAIEQDGIVMAGVVRKYNYSLCSTCYSLRLTKLDIQAILIGKAPYFGRLIPTPLFEKASQRNNGN